MEAISTLVRVGLPNYLSNLPIPETVGGWFSLRVGDWVRLIPFGAAVGGLSYLSLKGLAAAPGVGPAIQVGFRKRNNSTIVAGCYIHFLFPPSRSGAPQ